MARPNGTSVDTSAVEAEVARIQGMSKYDLIVLWRRTFQTHPPLGFTKGLIGRYLAYHVQEKAFGGLDRKTKSFLNALARSHKAEVPRPRRFKAGTLIIREYGGERHEVTVANDGFIWREKTYLSLSMIAREITGTSWNGPRFFGVRMDLGSDPKTELEPSDTSAANSRSKVRPKLSRMRLQGRP